MGSPFGVAALFLFSLTLAVRASLVVRPLPSLSVTVQSTSPQPTPRLTRFVVSKRTISQSDSVVFSAQVADCATCNVVVSVSYNPDVSQWNSFTSYVRTFASVTAGDADDWFNRTQAAPLVNTDWPSGAYYLAVRVSWDGQYRQSISYSPAQLTTLFGAGAGQLTLDNVEWTAQPFPPVTIDHWSITPRTITSVTQSFRIAIHLASSLSVNDFSMHFHSANLAYLQGSFELQAPNLIDNWVNMTVNIDGDSATNGVLQTGSYRPEMYYRLAQGSGQYLRITAAQAQASSGSDPSITLTGADFSSDHTPPSCNFTLSAATVNVNAAGASVGLNLACDKTVTYGSWYLAPPTTTPLTYLYNKEQTSMPTDTAIPIPAAGIPGVYSVYAIWVADVTGNVAVYSNHDPVLPTGIWQAQMLGEGWLIPDAVNRAAGELGPAGSASSVAGSRHSVAHVCAYAVLAFALLTQN